MADKMNIFSILEKLLVELCGQRLMSSMNILSCLGKKQKSLKTPFCVKNSISFSNYVNQF